MNRLHVSDDRGQFILLNGSFTDSLIKSIAIWKANALLQLQAIQAGRTRQ